MLSNKWSVVRASGMQVPVYLDAVINEKWAIVRNYYTNNAYKVERSLLIEGWKL